MARHYSQRITAVLNCCSNQHVGARYAIGARSVSDEKIIPAVMASIAYCDNLAKYGRHGSSGKRFAAAADKLRDFATVELLCADLGITRRELNND